MSFCYNVLSPADWNWNMHGSVVGYFGRRAPGSNSPVHRHVWTADGRCGGGVLRLRARSRILGSDRRGAMRILKLFNTRSRILPCACSRLALVALEGASS